METTFHQHINILGRDCRSGSTSLDRADDLAKDNMTLLNFNHKTRNIYRTEEEHKLIQILRKQEDSAIQESTTQLSSLNNWFGIDEICFYSIFYYFILKI